MTDYQRIRKAINQPIIDTDLIAEILSNNDFSKEELMQFAIATAKKYEFTDEWEQYCQKIWEDFRDKDIDDDGCYIKLYHRYQNRGRNRNTIKNQPTVWATD